MAVRTQAENETLKETFNDFEKNVEEVCMHLRNSECSLEKLLYFHVDVDFGMENGAHLDLDYEIGPTVIIFVFMQKRKQT